MHKLPWLGVALALSVAVGAMVPGASAQTDDERFKILRARGLGLDLYTEHCASCHGRTGHGNGPRAGELRTRPSDLTRLAERNGWTFPAAAVIRIIEGGDAAHRSREMPLWGDVFKASADAAGGPDAKTRIDALMRYLEFIQVRRR